MNNIFTSMTCVLALAAAGCAVDAPENDELVDLLEEHETDGDGKADGARPDVVIRRDFRDTLRIFNGPAQTIFDVLVDSGEHELTHGAYSTIVTTPYLRCGQSSRRTVCVADVKDSGERRDGGYFFYDFPLDSAPRTIGAAMIAAGRTLPGRHDIGRIGQVQCSMFDAAVLFASGDHCQIYPASSEQ